LVEWLLRIHKALGPEPQNSIIIQIQCYQLDDSMEQNISFCNKDYFENNKIFTSGVHDLAQITS
jgi:hypothetical protein